MMRRRTELEEALIPDPRDGHVRALDVRAGEMIPSILIGLALASACLALAQSALPGQPDDPGLLLVKISASVLFLIGRFVLERWPIPEGRAHLTGTVIASVALAVLLHQLQVTGEARETTFLLLLILGAGLSYLDLAWFAVLVSLTLGGWVLAAGSGLADPEWTYFGVALLMATILASIVVVVRVRGTNRVDAFQRQEGVQKLELETALQQTERARQGEEAARKAMERALVQVKESEERFRRLADASFEGVVIFREGRIGDANARAAELFNVVPAQLIGDPVANLIAPPDREGGERFLLEAGTRGFVESLEVEGRRYDGTRFPMELSVVDSMLGGRPARVLVIRDVTAQKRVEGVLRRALEEAEANSRAKSTFLANMSHELRTPLNSVIGFANILAKKQSGRVPDREIDYLKRIVGNGEHLLALIEDILDLSKIDAQRLEVNQETVDVVEVVEEVVRMLEIQAKKKGLALEAELPAEAEPIQADRRRLKQVLLNLAGNGIKFTQDGTVTIKVGTDHDGHPTRIEVIDSGIGIPEDQIEEIFSPFHQVDASRTRAFGGSGLGLAISRSLTRLMGFDLAVESEHGHGSVFRLDLAADRSVPAEALGGERRKSVEG
ncbi:MAG: ATP-binding protein [Gemmatimonadota bacterium]